MTLGTGLAIGVHGVVSATATATTATGSGFSNFQAAPSAAGEHGAAEGAAGDFDGGVAGPAVLVGAAAGEDEEAVEEEEEEKDENEDGAEDEAGEGAGGEVVGVCGSWGRRGCCGGWRCRGWRCRGSRGWRGGGKRSIGDRRWVGWGGGRYGAGCDEVLVGEGDDCGAGAAVEYVLVFEDVGESDAMGIRLLAAMSLAVHFLRLFSLRALVLRSFRWKYAVK